MIVIKIGGNLLKQGLTSTLLTDIKRILEKDRLAIVHGGGDEVTRTAERLGKPQKFISSPSGIRSRYTDEETVKIYAMVMAGKMNKEMVALLLSRGIPALGLSGIDAALMRATRKKRLIIIDERGRKRIIEGGFTGKITQVDKAVIQLLMDSGYVPVVSAVALGEDYELLNVDSDRAAAQIAGALKSDKIIFLTDVQGVLMNGKPVGKLSTAEAERLRPKMGRGMDKKVLASLEAIEMSVKEAIIAPGFVENPIAKAINHETGTVITHE